MVIFLIQSEIMLCYFPDKAATFHKNPSSLSALTNALLVECSEAHNTSNRLLPSSDISALLNIYQQYSITSSNANAAHLLLAASCLQILLKINFKDLKENKIYAAVVMTYGQILQKAGKDLKEQKQQNKAQMKLKITARGLLLTKIIIKLLQRTHSFLPEFYRFARLAIQTLKALLEDTKIESLPLTAKQMPQTLVFRTCFSKKVTRNIILHTLNEVQKLLKQFGVVCPSTKSLAIAKELKEEMVAFSETLGEEQKQILIEKIVQGVDEEENGNVYLQEPIEVKQLTPRIYDEQKAATILKLKRKKHKLKKRIETDLRRNVQVKQQQAQVVDDVRRERSQRQYKKQLFVIEKQTAEAKKMHNKMQKVKQIQKDKGKGGNSLKSRLDKLSQRRKKK